MDLMLPENEFAEVLVGSQQDRAGLIGTTQDLRIGNPGQNFCYCLDRIARAPD